MFGREIFFKGKKRIEERSFFFLIEIINALKGYYFILKSMIPNSQRTQILVKYE